MSCTKEITRGNGRSKNQKENIAEAHLGILPSDFILLNLF